MACRLFCLVPIWVASALAIPSVAAGSDLSELAGSLPVRVMAGVPPSHDLENLAGRDSDMLWSGNWDQDWNLDLRSKASFDDPERVYQSDEVLGLNLSPQGFRAARDLGFAISRPHRLEATALTLIRMHVPNGLTAVEALTALRHRDPKGFYDLNPVYRLASGGVSAAACGDVRCYPQSLIAWNESCSVSVRIGVLDSAIDRAHQALVRSRIRALRLGPGEPSALEYEHGTAIAALLVGSKTSAFPGLLPQAELVAADVFVNDGRGNLYTDAARMAAGLDWIAGQDPAAINISVTGADSSVLHTVIHRVTRLGIPIVAAVGNDGPAAPPAYPAAYEEVIAVTAVDNKMELYARANQGSYVALAAPGVDVWTPGPGTRGVLREGTSFAAPFVTAALARLKLAEPGSKPAELSTRLRITAKHLGAPGDNPAFGSGLLQVGNCSAL